MTSSKNPRAWLRIQSYPSIVHNRGQESLPRNLDDRLNAYDFQSVRLRGYS